VIELSEQILNGTSAQLGYTLPFTSIHDRKYRREDKLKTDATKPIHNPVKANNTKYSRKKLALFSRLLQHLARKQGELILQSSQSHSG